MEIGKSFLTTEVAAIIQPSCEERCRKLPRLMATEQRKVDKSNKGINPEHPWADSLACAAVVCQGAGIIGCKATVITGDVHRDGGEPRWAAAMFETGETFSSLADSAEAMRQESLQ